MFCIIRRANGMGNTVCFEDIKDFLGDAECVENGEWQHCSCSTGPVELRGYEILLDGRLLIGDKWVKRWVYVNGKAVEFGGYLPRRRGMSRLLDSIVVGTVLYVDYGGDNINTRSYIVRAVVEGERIVVKDWENGEVCGSYRCITEEWLQYQYEHGHLKLVQ